MDTLLGDLRFAVRSLRRRPSFAAIISSTIAIAVGATTTMMSVVNAAIVRPLPFRAADLLVFVDGFEKREQSPRSASYLEVRDWQRMNSASPASRLTTTYRSTSPLPEATQSASTPSSCQQTSLMSWV